MHVIVLLAAVLVTGATWSFAGSQEVDEGVVHTGVGSQDEAGAFPCPPGDSGPVVCVPDRGTAWELSTDATGECSQTAAGWHGDCVRAFDSGDHLRVWGTRGIPPRSFRITWSPERPTPGERDPAGDDTTSSSAPGGTRDEPNRATGDGPAAPDVAAPRPQGTAANADDPEPVRKREVPDGIVWDPPASELPGYRDLAAPPGPTYPDLPVTGRPGRGDAGAPAAAGTIALIAAGWVLWQRQRGRRVGALR